METVEVMRRVLSEASLGPTVWQLATELTGEPDSPGPNVIPVRTELEGWVKDITSFCLQALPPVSDLTGPDRIKNIVSMRRRTCEAVCGLDGLSVLEDAKTEEIARLCPGDVAEQVRRALHNLAHQALGHAWAVRDGQDPMLAEVRPEEREAFFLAQMDAMMAEDASDK